MDCITVRCRNSSGVNPAVSYLNSIASQDAGAASFTLVGVFEHLVHHFRGETPASQEARLLAAFLQGPWQLAEFLLPYRARRLDFACFQLRVRCRNRILRHALIAQL